MSKNSSSCKISDIKCQALIKFCCQPQNKSIIHTTFEKNDTSCCTAIFLFIALGRASLQVHPCPQHPPLSTLSHYSPAFLFPLCGQDKGAVILGLLVTMATVFSPPFHSPPHSQVLAQVGWEMSHFSCRSTI